MAGIFPPTDGTLRVEGRVAPMIELGVGFHPDAAARIVDALAEPA